MYEPWTHCAKEIRQKGKYHMIAFICGICKNKNKNTQKNKNQALGYREQIGGCLRWEGWG